MTIGILRNIAALGLMYFFLCTSTMFATDQVPESHSEASTQAAGETAPPPETSTHSEHGDSHAKDTHVDLSLIHI